MFSRLTQSNNHHWVEVKPEEVMMDPEKYFMVDVREAAELGKYTGEHPQP